MDNLIKGNFNNQENKEHLNPREEMIAYILDLKEGENLDKKIVDKFEEKKRKEEQEKKKNSPEVSRENIDAAIRVLNQIILPPEEKLVEHVSTLQEVLKVYRKRYLQLNKFLNLKPEDWAPTGDDIKDTEIIKNHFGFSE